eukprot:CAMPEP_0198736562 /NCGR_PEP_ID=MMETSP1475-20131203/66507_1 /TAXON_ID= ORGANISM="Unidentified sp., Strain CCMP1999" /NCGR_SAMPLE_ID=MMETSP1475 /ASSEMBLY_ACC=CAM_ASM_001111 /LENGTH=47 /DNA_ID= /DNA_START= /DNA_END= /DNA_ORIENTATION=
MVTYPTTTDHSPRPLDHSAENSAGPPPPPSSLQATSTLRTFSPTSAP